MSGGSFEYLCYASVADMFNGKMHQLESMAATLRAEGYHKAATETENILQALVTFEADMQKRIDAIYLPWRAMEWYVSCDIGKDSLDTTIEEWAASKC